MNDPARVALDFWAACFVVSLMVGLALTVRLIDALYDAREARRYMQAHPRLITRLRACVGRVGGSGR